MRHFIVPPSDRFHLRFPDEWFFQDIIDKYNGYLSQFKGHVTDIVSLLNSSIKAVEIMGFNVDTETQEQGGGLNHTTAILLGTKSWKQALSDNVVTIELFHTDSYITWGFLWENFRRQFSASHKETIKSPLKVKIKNLRDQEAFSFTFNDNVLVGLDNLSLDASTEDNDFGKYKLTMAFASASADFNLFDVKNPRT